jgi:hypothetical protein
MLACHPGCVGKQRRAYLHVGLDDGSGSVLDDTLRAHEHALLELHVRRPADSPATFRAALDVLDLHGDWGYDRAEVDGAWDDLVARARRGRDTIVISQSLLARAEPDRARRVVEALDGFDVHAVVTARAPEPGSLTGGAGRDLAEVLPRWAGAVGAADHVHVLLGDPASTWKALGRVAGFGTASLRVAAPTVAAPAVVDPETAAAWRAVLGSSAYDVVGDPDVLTGPAPDDAFAAVLAALAEAHDEVSRLRHRSTDLEQRLAKAEKKKRKLKRRLSELG